jgi:hypothetical protein
MKTLLLLPAVAAAVSCASTPPPDVALHAILRDQYADSGNYGRDARYSLAFVDLDEDESEEAVVRISGSGLCGSGGCDAAVFTRSGNGWREVTGFTITWPPIRLLDTRTNGWRDLSVKVAGGGIRPGYEARLPFDGRTYPENPSVAPAEPLRPGTPGRVLIAEDDEGYPLFD